MADEDGVATPTTDAEPTQDEFDRTLGGTPDDSQTPADDEGTAAGDTPDFDWESINIETVDLDTVPAEARPAVEAFQRRAREMSAGVSKKVGEVKTYEKELLDAQARIKELETSTSQDTAKDTAAATSRTPGQSAEAIAKALGVDRNNSSEGALKSLQTVADIIDHHPFAGELQNLKAEIATIKEQAGMAAGYVTAEQDRAYSAEYEAAVKNHGKDVTDRIVDLYADLRGRPGLDGQPLTVDAIVAQMTGKTAAAGNGVTEAARKARRQAQEAAGGVTGTAGLGDDGQKTPTNADIEALFQ